MDFGNFIMMLVMLAIALVLIEILRRVMTPSKTTNEAQASAAKPQPVPSSQMAEDIRATKTSQVSDAVAILDDLGSTSQNYRHYCELVGTSMASGGVVAPYSKRSVAYYDIKCYRIDRTYGGRQEETLVAHEHSFDPFFFTDASCDTPIYVDLESFGENVILVNSTNHVEGPSSDFAKAFQRNASSTGAGAGTAYAMVAHAVSRLARVLAGGYGAVRDALRLRPTLVPQAAYALAGDWPLPTESATKLGSNVTFAGRSLHGSSGSFHGGHSSSGSGSNGHSSSGHRHGPSGRPPQIHLGYGPSPMPGHLGDFMGGGGPWVMGGGYAPRRTTDSGDILLGMTLEALLNSLNTSQQQTTSETDTFCGYRLVENVVPLGSPVYCIGEIYRMGTSVYMGRSLAKDYPTSYFATKPESEVLSAIGSK